MRELSCPNCAGTGPQDLGHGDYRCQFCGTLFRDDKTREQKIADERRQAGIRKTELQYQAKMNAAIANQQNRKGAGRVLLFVGVFLLLIFGFVGYMVKKSMDQQEQIQKDIMDQQKEMQEEMMKQFQQ